VAIPDLALGADPRLLGALLRHMQKAQVRSGMFPPQNKCSQGRWGSSENGYHAGVWDPLLPVPKIFFGMVSHFRETPPSPECSTVTVHPRQLMIIDVVLQTLRVILRSSPTGSQQPHRCRDHRCSVAPCHNWALGTRVELTLETSFGQQSGTRLGFDHVSGEGHRSGAGTSIARCTASIGQKIRVRGWGLRLGQRTDMTADEG
jgi:hypothetical protein